MKGKSDKNNLIVISLILFLLFFRLPIQLEAAEDMVWDEEWNYSQEIMIPINTNLETAKYQPVDIKIVFDNKCWAKNEKDHSIRVICLFMDKWYELESQIYDLQSINTNYIDSCSLVFLIPEFADGNEKYYIYYSDSEKNSPGYTDHVQIEESYYHYEPISGYALESSYFKIIDNGYCNYVVSQQGHFMGYNTSQHITKMNEKINEIKPKNGDAIAAFDFRYSYFDDVFDYSSTSQKIISKEIINDGNLMIEFGMISRSKLDDLQTTANYKYYHCPTFSQSRIHVHIKHEALKDIKLDDDIVFDTNTDGVYATLQAQAVKSNTIDDLNFGEIYPYLHLDNEMNTISEFNVDVDPEYVYEDLDVRIISITDDVDLGANCWVSFDEGESGVAHAIIFYSNDVLISGSNERNGLQVNAYEMDYPHLPGLENNMANIIVSRNSYDRDGTLDDFIPQDFVVEFDAEFFSTKIGGYTIINDEAKTFRNLIENKPEYTSDFYDEKNYIEKHDLSINIHLAPSIPFGSSLSAFFGKNFSYIVAELYRDDEYISSESAVRLPMKTMYDFDSSQKIKTIIQSVKYFEWRNLSFYKKVIFSDVEEGKYVVKIFRENSIFSKDRQYIGYAIVDLKNDMKIDVNCRSEGKISYLIVDQNNNKVDNAELLLKDNNLIIARYVTNKEGEADIKAPKNSREYILEVLYKGFLVYEDSIKINTLSELKFDIIKIIIERYNIKLEIIDKWGLSPNVELNPILLNDISSNQIIIKPNITSDSNYAFNYIPKGEYKLLIRFKSFIVEESIKLEEDLNLKIEFPAEFKINIISRDSRGIIYTDPIIYLSRGDKKIRLDENNNDISELIPPGKYNLEIYDNQELIYRNDIDVLGDSKFDVITNYKSLIPLFLLSIGMITIIIFIIMSYLKKNIKILLTFIPIILVFISILYPWWIIQGSSNQITSTTSMFLYPLELVTMTISPQTLAGELAYIPDLFTLAVNIFLILSFLGSISLALSYYFDKKNNKKTYLFSLITSIIMLIVAISIFVFALNELSSITVGNIIGNGYINSNIAEEGLKISLNSTWGFGSGFYIYLITISFILLNLIYFFKKK